MAALAALLALACLLGGAARAQQTTTRVPPAAVESPAIVVGQPKLYDARALIMMLKGVEESLARIGFVDQSSVASALGRLQGATADTSSLSVSLSTLPTPQVATTTTTNAKDIPDPSQPSVSQTITQNSASPSVPTLPARTSIFSTAVPFGVASQDLLGEQMSLTYQLLNLRMLLDMSLTDRLPTRPIANPEAPQARAFAVLGFQISIDPRKKHQNQLAEVEITLENAAGASRLDSPNLVALFPKDKTYNVATVTKNASQFGAGAILQVISLGVGSSSTRETAYLVKDTDTVAFERPSAEDETRFAWQFRPVLGRKQVEPGTRQVFALVSLPTTSQEDYRASLSVATRWRSYDGKRKLVGDKVQNDSDVVTIPLVISRLETVETALQPKILNVDWQDAGAGQVAVTVDGDFFLPGTAVNLGPAVLTPAANGFAVQGDNRLRFIAPAQTIALSAPRILGRYGKPKEIKFVPRDVVADQLRSDQAASGSSGTSGASGGAATSESESSSLTNNLARRLAALDRRTITPENVYELHPEISQNPDLLSEQPALSIASARAELRDNATAMVELQLSYVSGAMPNPPRPLVVLNGQVYGLSNAPYTSQVQEGDSVTVRFPAPVDALRAAGSVRVLELLMGNRYRAQRELKIQGDFTATSAAYVGQFRSGDAQMPVVRHRIAITGSGLDPLPNFRVGPRSYPEDDPLRVTAVTPTLVLLDLSEEEAATVRQIVVARGPDVPPVSLNSPVPPNVPQPTITGNDPVSAGDVIRLRFVGGNLGSIAHLEFQGAQLPVEVARDGRSMTVALSSAVTQGAGRKDLKIILTNGRPAGFYSLQVAPPRP